MDVIPYKFRPAQFLHTKDKGYWVTLYMFFDGTSTHTFYHQSDLLDNMSFAQECGLYCYPITSEILVTADTFPLIFKEILDYVSQSNND